MCVPRPGTEPTTLVHREDEAAALPVRHQLITSKKGGQRDSDVEANKLESVSLSASPGGCSFAPQGSQHCSSKGMDTPPFPLQYPVVGGWGERGCRGRCLTLEACQSNEGVDSSKSPRKPGKLFGSEESTGPSQIQMNTTQGNKESTSLSPSPSPPLHLPRPFTPSLPQEHMTTSVQQLPSLQQMAWALKDLALL